MNLTSMYDDILNFVNNYYKEQRGPKSSRGVTAKIVSCELGIWQNDAATALNALAKQGLLQKKGSRPICYFPADAFSAEKSQESSSDSASAFRSIIGYDGSLAPQVQLAKAGASYPPNGMHTLITGESGVGKTMMAEAIWRYMDMNRSEKDPPRPFVVFNCAEYAENPQLLLSHLFGHERGAFTGAEATHRGLVEDANHGVLFLDEIHRLPETGQEMLFTLIDRGQFRRLGSNESREASLMIIGATTEDPETALLKTFRRRIPLIIKIPSLSERPIKERIALIFHFVSEEAQKLGIPVQISPHSLELLVSFESDTNIGDLKNEIQICCARSYLDYLNIQQHAELEPSYIDFRVSNLSRSIQACEVSADTRQFLNNWNKHHSLLVSCDLKKPEKPEDTSHPGLDLYHFIENKLADHQKEDMNPFEIRQMISIELQSYISKIHLKSSSQDSSDKSFNLYDSVSGSILATADEIVRLASSEFSYAYPDNVRDALALYLQQIKFQADMNQASFNAGMQQLLTNIPADEAKFSQKILPVLSKALNISLTENEMAVIALMLDPQHSRSSKRHVGLVLMAHGFNTAGSIADFTNQVLMTDIVQAVNVTIESSYSLIRENLLKAVHKSDEGRGVIILTDCDNFEYYEQLLQDASNTPCRVIPLLTISSSMELCKMILTTDDDMETIVQTCLSANYEYLQVLFQRVGVTGQMTATVEEKRAVILVQCITGLGSARRVRDWLLQFPSISTSAEIIPIGFQNDMKELTLHYGKRIKLIIGLIDFHIPGVPFLSMDKLASDSTVNRVAMLIRGWNNPNLDVGLNDEHLSLHDRFSQINQRLNYFAPSLDSALIARQADYVTESMRRLTDRKFSDDFYVRLYIHVITMFERLNTQEPLVITEEEAKLIHSEEALYDSVSKIIQDACTPLNLSAPPAEIYWFMLTFLDGDSGEDPVA